MKAQYAILRFAKYKGPEIGHIESHNERTKEKYARRTGGTARQVYPRCRGHEDKAEKV